MNVITRRQLLIDGSKTLAGASALATFLAACGGSATPDAPGSKVTLKYWVTNYSPTSATGKLTNQALDAYKKKHSNLDFKVTGYTGDQAGFTKITQAIQGGSSVDVFRYPADELPFLVKQGLVTPIDDYLTDADKADIFPNLLDAMKFNGKVYAFPLWVPPVGMYLNLDIFKERNIEVPGNDWTYEQFVDIAKQLTFKRSDGTQVYGYTGAIDPGLVNTWPFIMGDGGYPLSDDHKQYTFDSAESISGLQKLVDLAQKYKVTPPDFGTQSPDAIIAGFSQKKTYAMYSAPSGDSSGYKTAGLNFDIKPMPIMQRGKPFTTGGIGLIAVAKINDQNQLKEAMNLARYLTSGDVANDVQGYYLAPGARKSVTVQDPIDKFTPLVENTYLMPMITQWSQVRTLIHTQLQNAVLGKATPTQALKAPAQEINSLLANG